jgi:hypothetical protein
MFNIFLFFYRIIQFQSTHLALPFFPTIGYACPLRGIFQEDIPVLQEIVQRGRASGLTGFGAGDGYMQPGSMHIGFGPEAVWGAGGKGDGGPKEPINAEDPGETFKPRQQQPPPQPQRGGTPVNDDSIPF